MGGGCGRGGGGWKNGDGNRKSGKEKGDKRLIKQKNINK